MSSTRLVLCVSLLSAACGPSPRGNVDANGSGAGSDGAAGGDGGSPNGCAGLLNCYSVYAHSDTVLYVIDLQQKTLTTVGPFDAPTVGSGSSAGSDVMTDLAVAPDDTIYAISETALYTVSATTGKVTTVGSLAACGTRGVALTTTPDGKLWERDYSGKLCEIDISGSAPVVGAPVTMGSGMALSGDMVATGDGTVFGTAYKLSDSSGSGTQKNNLLVTINLATGAVTQIGSTGYAKLFGTSFANGQVFGFTHDASGDVVTIDPTTGVGTLYKSFSDPQTNMPISFAGAGVNSLVPIVE